jgi:hypothetical protein
MTTYMLTTISNVAELLNVPTFTLAAYLGKFPPRTQDYFRATLPMDKVINAICYFGNHPQATESAKAVLRLLAHGQLRFTSEGDVLV